MAVCMFCPGGKRGSEGQTVIDLQGAGMAGWSIAKKLGVHKSAVYNHLRHLTSGPTIAQASLEKDIEESIAAWSRLALRCRQKQNRGGEAEALRAIDGLRQQLRVLRAESKPSTRSETAFVVRYEQADGTLSEADPEKISMEEAARPAAKRPATIGVREALGFSPEAARRLPGLETREQTRARLVRDLAGYLNREDIVVEKVLDFLEAERNGKKQGRPKV